MCRFGERFAKSVRRRVELAALVGTAALTVGCLVTGEDTDAGGGSGRVRLLRLLLVMRCTPTIRLLALVGDYSTFAKVGGVRGVVRASC